jgi:hypothetical protein
MNYDKNPYEKDYGYNPELDENSSLTLLLIIVVFEIILIGSVHFLI